MRKGSIFDVLNNKYLKYLGNFKVCAYTVIFKTVEAANEFLNLAKVMYGNVELGRLTHQDHHTLNKMEKWNVVLTATQRYKLIHNS